MEKKMADYERATADAVDSKGTNAPFNYTHIYTRDSMGFYLCILMLNCALG